MLHLHRAERADGLVTALRGLLAAPLPDPFAREVIAELLAHSRRDAVDRELRGLASRAGLEE